MFLKKFTKNDYEIIRILVDERDFNSKSIAEKIGVSDKTIRNRMKMMLKQGVLKKIVMVDQDLFGYNLKIDFYLNVKSENVEKVTEWLEKEHEHCITYLARHWGTDDISIQTVFQNSKKADKFTDTLKKNKLIDGYKIAVVPIVLKDSYNWRPPQSDFRITDKGLEELEYRRKVNG